MAAGRGQGSGSRRLGLSLTILLCLGSWLSACAPTSINRGSDSTEARLDGDRFITEDNAALRLQSWLPAEAPHTVMVAVHGMNEYSHAFALPAEAWRDRGIAVYALDQRGFGDNQDRGLWPGAQNLASDLNSLCRLLRQTYPDLPIFLLGESMGGAVTVLAAAQNDPPPVDGIVLVAPAISPWEVLPFYWRAPLWLMAHTVPWLPLTGRGLDLRPTDNLEVWYATAHDDLLVRETRVDSLYGLTDLMDQAADSVPRVRLPALLLYGKKDQFVRNWMVEWVVEQADPGLWQQLVYDEGHHWLLRDLNRATVLADIETWMQRQAGSQ